MSSQVDASTPLTMDEVATLMYAATFTSFGVSRKLCREYDMCSEFEQLFTDELGKFVILSASSIPRLCTSHRLVEGADWLASNALNKRGYALFEVLADFVAAIEFMRAEVRNDQWYRHGYQHTCREIAEHRALDLDSARSEWLAFLIVAGSESNVEPRWWKRSQKLIAEHGTDAWTEKLTGQAHENKMLKRARKIHERRSHPTTVKTAQSVSEVTQALSLLQERITKPTSTE